MHFKIPKGTIFLSTIIIFITASIFHFLYDFLGKNYLIRLFTPVNESVFEHLKLALYPVLLWWLIFYFIKKDKYYLDDNKWILGALISVIIAILTVVSIHYVVRYGFGIKSLAIDIISLYIGILVGQFSGYFVYIHTKHTYFYSSWALIIAIVVIFMLLTIYPPKMPMFKDSLTERYGIKNELK